MFKTILLGTVLAALAVQYNHTTTMNDATTMAQPQAAASIYDFKVPSLDGGTIDFAAFKGKKILIVNTASQCGYTPQYEGLQKLYTTQMFRFGRFILSLIFGNISSRCHR